MCNLFAVRKIDLTVVLPDTTRINVKVTVNDKVENVMKQIQVRTTISRIVIVYLSLKFLTMLAMKLCTISSSAEKNVSRLSMFCIVLWNIFVLYFILHCFYYILNK